MAEKLLEAGEQIEYVRTVGSPPDQAAKAGETRVVGETITKFAARLLHKGGCVKRAELPTERRASGRRTDGKADAGETPGQEV